MIEQYSQ